jgi:multidrug efflux pump subunit AcrA (membrane-fusion protein)
VTGDQSRVNADQAKVTADNSQVQAAQFSVSSAQDSYNSQAVNRPATVEQQQAAVSSAEAQVATAQQNLDAATLTAPISGVVSAVNAGVGDGVAPGGSSSGSQAPGTTALLPGSSGSTGGGASASGSAGGGSTGFMTLITDNAYEAIVPFAESDAAKIQSGQTGTINFDALNGVSLPVHVLAVAPTSTVTSNVVNYYATVLLDRADSRLRSGLTSNVTITTAEATNVLVVPNAAITRLGAQAFVTLVQAGKEVRQAVELGVTGDSLTQVLSGLRLGDRVVLPTRSSTTNATTTTRGGGLGGPGGGAGLGLGR